MSAKTLQQILGYENLLKMVTNPEGGVPADILPTGFTSLTERVEGNYGKWTVTANTRQTAKTTSYGGPSQPRDKQGITTKGEVLLHTFEHIIHDMATTLALRNFDNPEQQQLGEKVIDYQTTEFQKLFVNLRTAAIYSALTYGAIYVDSSGNLLPTSSGAAMTVDLGISANHKNQLNGIVGTAWDSASADILGNIGAIKAQARKDSGKALKYAFYGSAIPGYFAANTAIKALLPGNQQLATSLMSGEIPKGFGAPYNQGGQPLIWIPIYEAFFNDAAGTDQTIVPSDFVIFTPEPDPSWYGMLEGTYAVPTSLNAAGDAMEALRNLKVVQGMFSYAKVLDDPVQIKHCAGDTFLPTFKRDVIYQLDTKF